MHPTSTRTGGAGRCRPPRPPNSSVPIPIAAEQHCDGWNHYGGHDDHRVSREMTGRGTMMDGNAQGYGGGGGGGRLLKLSIKEDEPGEASGSRTPPAPVARWVSAPDSGGDVIARGQQRQCYRLDDLAAATAVRYDDDDDDQNKNLVTDEEKGKRGGLLKFCCRRDAKQKGVERLRCNSHIGGQQPGRRGLRKRFRDLGERLRRLCERRRRRKALDKGKGKMNETVLEGEVGEVERRRYKGSDVMHRPGGGGGVSVGGSGGTRMQPPAAHAYPLSSHQVRTMSCQMQTAPPPDGMHPALRARMGGEEGEESPIGFFCNPPQQQHPQLATVQESSSLSSSGFVTVNRTVNNHQHDAGHRPSEFLPRHYKPHQQVIIASSHPIADTYTHEEDWAHVHQAQAQAARAKASQQTMYTNAHNGLAPKPSPALIHPLAIPERHSSRWRARSFVSGSFRSRSRNRSQCGSFDSRSSWNPFDLPGPPKKTLMSEMESLLQGRRGLHSRDGGGLGGGGSRGSTPAGMLGRKQRSQASMATMRDPSAGVGNNDNDNDNNWGLGAVQREFLWASLTRGDNSEVRSPTAGDEMNNSTVQQLDSAVNWIGSGLRVDKDGFMLPAIPHKPSKSSPVGEEVPQSLMIPVRTPSTATNPTLGRRNSSQKTDSESNTGTSGMTWTGTGSSTLNNPVMLGHGLGKTRTESSASTLRTAGKVEEEDDDDDEEEEEEEEELEGDSGNDGERQEGQGGVWWVKEDEITPAGGRQIGGREVKDRVEVLTVEAKVGGGKKKGKKVVC